MTLYSGGLVSDLDHMELFILPLNASTWCFLIFFLLTLRLTEILPPE